MSGLVFQTGHGTLKKCKFNDINFLIKLKNVF